MKTTTNAGTLVEVLETFTFTDGRRMAWVTWRVGNGDPRCVGVREWTPGSVSAHPIQ